MKIVLQFDVVPTEFASFGKVHTHSAEPLAPCVRVYEM